MKIMKWEELELPEVNVEEEERCAALEIESQRALEEQEEWEEEMRWQEYLDEEEEKSKAWTLSQVVSFMKNGGIVVAMAGKPVRVDFGTKLITMTKYSKPECECSNLDDPEEVYAEHLLVISVKHTTYRLHCIHCKRLMSDSLTREVRDYLLSGGMIKKKFGEIVETRDEERALWKRDHDPEGKYGWHGDGDRTVSNVVVEEMPLCERDFTEGELKNLPYFAYLLTKHWEAVKTATKERDGHRCRLCNTKRGKLSVHHSTYVRKGKEDVLDTVTLCEDCHARHHGVPNSELAKDLESLIDEVKSLGAEVGKINAAQTMDEALKLAKGVQKGHDTIVSRFYGIIATARKPKNVTSTD